MFFIFIMSILGFLGNLFAFEVSIDHDDKRIAVLNTLAWLLVGVVTVWIKSLNPEL